MNKKIGGIFSLFFLISSGMNFYANGGNVNKVSIICLLFSTAYLVSSLNNTIFFRILQVSLTALLVFVSMVLNPPQSLVSLLSFGVFSQMIQAYFKGIHFLSVFLFIPYIIFSFLLNWSFTEVAFSAFLFITYPTILFILYRDKA